MYSELLGILEIHPVLVDVGASLEPPSIWQSLSKSAVYVGFDPDEREMHDIANGAFHRTIIVNKAITDQQQAETIPFYLTRSPLCSSTLPPNMPVLSHYLYADWFTVEQQIPVPATTLNKALERLELPLIHWLKLDSQGTDLRLLKSLKPGIFDQLLAVDVEPGFSEFYTGEDLFTDIHPFLTNHGFWLSDMNIKGSTRMRLETLGTIGPSVPSSEDLQSRLKSAPGWVEARYLRELDHIESREQHVLLCVFAILDQQIGYAFDVVQQYRERFGEDAISRNLFGITRKLLQPSVRELVRGQIRKVIPEAVKKLLRTRLSKL